MWKTRGRNLMIELGGHPSSIGSLCYNRMLISLALSAPVALRCESPMPMIMSKRKETPKRLPPIPPSRQVAAILKKLLAVSA